MKEILKFIGTNILIASIIYLLIAFVAGDINLFDDIADNIGYRILTLFMYFASLGMTLSLYQDFGD